MLDEIDEQILHDIMAGDSYETIADNSHLALNTVKYRVHAMTKNAAVSGQKRPYGVNRKIQSYNLKRKVLSLSVRVCVRRALQKAIFRHKIY